MTIRVNNYSISRGVAMMASLGILTGCAIQPTRLSPVGPEPPCCTGRVRGSLEVFTATEDPTGGNDPVYYPHTAYVIHGSDGTELWCVKNRFSDQDESPEIVNLPVGHYQIIADSEYDGRVSIPVTIAAGRLTVVDLEGDRRAVKNIQVDPVLAVRTPQGQVVGWRAGS